VVPADRVRVRRRLRPGGGWTPNARLIADNLSRLGGGDRRHRGHGLGEVCCAQRGSGWWCSTTSNTDIRPGSPRPGHGWSPSGTATSPDSPSP
jgi:hypothetical protein